MILSRRYKQSRSFFLLLFFLTIIISLSTVSELFQSVNNPFRDMEFYQSPLTENFLAGVDKLKIKNKLGEFEFQKILTSERYTWQMIAPRKIPAQTETLNRLINNLRAIKVKKLFQKDLINLSHFSLDSPLLSLSMNSKSQGEIVLNFGLVNTINNSTYVALEGGDIIYQTEPLLESFESKSLSEFIDANPFSLKENQISKVEIYRGRSSSSSLKLYLTQKEGVWANKKGNPYIDTRVKDFLKALINAKSKLILDERTVNMQKDVDKFFKNPLHEIKIADKLGESIHYKVSPAIFKLSDVKIPKGQYIIIEASDKPHPYMVPKSYLKVLKTRESQLKDLKAKMLFY